MKFLSCHIDAFGCLRDFDLTFEEGITRIYAQNGFGKTTLGEFIRAMLYGFPRAARDPEKNGRKKYAPWEGGVYGGWLRFSRNGRIYRVHRTFGDTPRQDRFLLLDEQTGQLSRDYSQELGQELFGLDADAFIRCTYFPQSPPQNENAGSLLARLSQFVEDTEDLQSFDRAIRTLRASRSACVPYKGTGGIAARASDRISRLQLQLRDLEQQQAFLLTQQEELAAARQALSENRAMETALQEALLESTRLQGQEALYRQYQHLTAQLSRTQAELSALEARYPQGIPTRQELTQRQKARTPDPDLARFFAPGVPDDRFLSRCHGLLSRIQAETQTPLSRFLPGALLLLGGFCLIPVLLPLAMALLAAGICCTAFAAHKQWTLSRRKKELSGLLAPYFGFSSAFAENLLTLENNLTLYRRECSGSHATDPAMDALWEDLLTYAQLQQQLASQKEALQALYPQGIPERPQKAASQPEALNRQLEALRREITGCSADIARLEQSCASLQEQLQLLPELQDQLLRSQKEKEEALQNSRLLDLTMEYLLEARQNLSGRYLHKLRSRFGYYMQQLLQEDPEGIFLSDQLQVRLVRAGQPRSSGVLSKGQADLTEFSMRLALADTLFPEEKPLLILDDPFVNLDKTHRETVLALLETLSETCQILYLTCHT